MIRSIGAWMMGATTCFATAALLAGCGAATGDPSEQFEEQTADVKEGCKTTAAFDKEYKRLVTTSTFKGADGKPVRYRIYRNLGQDKAVVVFLNGRAEFIEKYDSLFTSLRELPQGVTPEQTLADMPVTFVTLDHEGQGASMEDRIAAHIDDFDLFVQDVGKLFQQVPELRIHRKPVFLAAHSMGGLVAARFAQQNQDKVDGLVLSSPMLGFLAPPPATAEQLGQIAYLYSDVLGLDKLCTSPPGVPVEALIAIGACHADDTLRGCFYDPSGPICPYLTQCLLVGLPADCGLPPIDFAGLNATLQYLRTLPPGCEPTAPFCPNPDLTTSDDACWFSQTHALHAPEATFGWLYQGFVAQGELWSGPTLDMPTLILSNTNDTIVDASTHVCAGPFSEECTLVTYTDRGHELLTGNERADPLAVIRSFIKAQAGF